ncbi:Protection of telomeres homolog 1 [Caenorhabditis elegans]|uniref:Isoform c of Protection of telomeres homolog 1 n=1 Tax=Caenorhabditis elegans TaxID=6239 RepID=P42001-3|nr:Protection of telomeres homolog 1 [Caenorhabditis elegans]SPC47521.1 Protection of telomeres homolog 1 [Caenorhabditis elegans]|eukprot:NP_001348726.1 Protection Of Telomeres 1 (Pot1) homolog [Caenorhabditis elegans]
MQYTYQHIQDLVPGPTPQNFYGKIIFIKKKINQIVVLIKLRQVVRVHRCKIQSILNSKEGIAQIGLFGCHLIAWSQSGKVDNPVIISSRSWTKSDEDSERLQTLRKLGKSRRKSGRKTSVDTMANKLIERREAMFADTFIKSLFNKIALSRKEHLSRNARELFYHRPGDIVETQNLLEIDDSWFNDENSEQFVQYVLNCTTCHVEYNHVEYAQNNIPTNCRFCQEAMESFHAAFRIRISIETYGVFLTIPLELIKTELDICEDWDSESNIVEEEEKVTRFKKNIQEKVRDASIVHIKGISSLLLIIMLNINSISLVNNITENKRILLQKSNVPSSLQLKILITPFVIVVVRFFGITWIYSGSSCIEEVLNLIDNCSRRR